MHWRGDNMVEKLLDVIPAINSMRKMPSRMSDLQISQKKGNQHLMSIAAIVLAVTGTSAAGCADGLACAVVKETPDRFVALRSKPNASATTLAKLQPYEILVVEVSDCEMPYWRQVFCVPRLDGDCYLQKKSYTTGCVHKNLALLTACPKDMN